MSRERIVGFIDAIQNGGTSIVDADPILGSISFAVAGNTIQMLDGAAEGDSFNISAVVADDDKLRTNSDLSAAGVLVGDKYSVIDNFFAEVDDPTGVDRDRVETDRADSSKLWNDLRNRLVSIEDMIRGSRVIEGTITGISGVTITIADTSFGEMINVEPNMITEILTGINAERKRFRVLSKTTTTITHNENLEDEGVVIGNIVRVIQGLAATQVGGHIHNGVDSIEIDTLNLNPYAIFGGMF